jgi:hypothetical protein
MPVIDVACAIKARLGAPTVETLSARFGADGTCPDCRTRFGTARLSLCAFSDEAEHLTLVAYHAGCRATEWLDAPGLDRSPTWHAAMTTCWVDMPPSGTPAKGAEAHHRPSRWRRVRTPGGEPRRHGLLRRRPRHARHMQVPVLLVHPRLESARVRMVGPEESVNADIEGYHRLGFADAVDLAAGPLAPVGAARLMTAGRPSAHIVVRAGFETWAAPVPSPSLLTLIRARGGVLVGVGCEVDAEALATDPPALATAIDRGDILLGWTPLRPA